MASAAAGCSVKLHCGVSGFATCAVLPTDYGSLVDNSEAQGFARVGGGKVLQVPAQAKPAVSQRLNSRMVINEDRDTVPFPELGTDLESIQAGRQVYRDDGARAGVDHARRANTYADDFRPTKHSSAQSSTAAMMVSAAASRR
nr:hypothetical protein [Paenarthrobacter nicotinovorans]